MKFEDELAALAKRAVEMPGETGPETALAAEGLAREPVVDLASAARASLRDPLSDCLTYLVKHFDRSTETTALAAGLPLEDGRFTPAIFVRAAERAGLKAGVVRRELDDLSPVLLPAILLTNDGGAMILVGRQKDGQFDIALPEAEMGVSSATVADLQPLSSGYLVLVKPEQRLDRDEAFVGLRPEAHWFWGLIRSMRRDFAIVALAAGTINLIALAVPLFTMHVYDRVLPNTAFPTLWVLALGIGVALSFDFVLRSLRDRLIALAGRRADVILSARIFEHVVGLDFRHRPQDTGSFMNSLRDFEILREFMTSNTVVAFIDLMFLGLFLSVIYSIAGWMVVPLVVGLVLVITIGVALQALVAGKVDRNVAESARRHSFLMESLNALETIKLCRAEGQMLRVWEELIGGASRTSTDVRRVSAFALNSTAFVQQLVTVAMIVVGVYSFAAGQISMGAIIAAIILGGRAAAPLGNIAATIARARHAVIAYRNIDTVMQLPREKPWEAQYVARSVARGRIEFRDVTFTYPEGHTPALSGISLKIEPGERLGILGRIGSGKTSIGRLLAGLYQPDEGYIMMDGIDIRQYSVAEVRRAVGFVSQDAGLFAGSVRENIVLGMPEVDDDVLIRAAELAGVMPFVQRHPRGFDMQVGEGGRFLSTGQRQSVILARALLTTPPILFLDEPSGTMDIQSEKLLVKHLKESISPEQTLLLTTHRSATLELVNRLVVVDDGKIIIDGPKDKVLSYLSGTDKARK